MDDCVLNGPFSHPTGLRSLSLLRDDASPTFIFDIAMNLDRSGHASGNSFNASPTSSDPPNMRINRTAAYSPGYNEVVRVRSRKPEVLKVSHHKMSCPHVPISVVKKLSTSLFQSLYKQDTKIDKDTLLAILQASDRFFEQVGTDLGAYAEHASRKTVDEADIVVLMKRYISLSSYAALVFKADMSRQRLLTAQVTLFSLAQQILPRELLQNIRMAQLKGDTLKKEYPKRSLVDEDDGV